jgi:uncharacterized membrane protein
LQAVLQQRCVQCHGAEVQMKTCASMCPNRWPRVRRSSTNRWCSKLMPLNNATQMTEAERALVARWFQAGAPVR